MSAKVAGPPFCFCVDPINLRWRPLETSSQVPRRCHVLPHQNIKPCRGRIRENTFPGILASKRGVWLTCLGNFEKNDECMI